MRKTIFPGVEPWARRARQYAIGFCLAAGSIWVASAATVKWNSAIQMVSETSGEATITAVLDAPAAGTVTVPFVVSGTADASDHDLVSGSIVIASPATIGQVTFNISDDLIPETDETIFVQMGAVTGAVTGTPDTHIVQILDDDLNRDTAGLDFCITFPGNREVPGVTMPQLLELFIVGEPIAPAANISGTVTCGAIGFSANFTVQSGQVTTIQLPDTAAIKDSDIVHVDQAVLIHADGPVTVYALNTGLTTGDIATSSDGFLAFPEHSLGVDHIIMANAGIGSQFTVVGCEDNTTVTITPTIDIVSGILQGTSSNGSHPAGVPFNVTLNRGDVYQLRHGLIDDGDFTGTTVVGSAPIAVFGGDLCGEVPFSVQYCDHMVEQLMPTEAWGRSYQSMPFKERLAEVYRFLASEDDTEVIVNREDPPGSGNVVSTVVASGLKRGEHVDFFNGEPRYLYRPGEAAVLNPAYPTPPVPLDIQANKPLMATQVMPGTTFDSVLGDPSAMNLAWFEQYLPRYTLATPTTGYDKHYLNLIVSDLDFDNVLINGIPISAFTAQQFQPIANSGFSGMQIEVEPGAYTLEASLPMTAYLYGVSDGNSYAYSAGLNLASVAKVTDIDLQPELGAPKPVGEQHCVVATVQDSNGNSVFGVRVDFFVQGANQSIGFAFADENGVASFCYTGTYATGPFGGADLIEARVGSLSDTGTMTWTGGESANPPTLEFSANLTLEAVSAAGAPASLGAVAGDIDGDAVQVEWRVNGGLVQTDTVLASPGQSTGPSPLSYTETFPLGLNNIDVSASDGLAPPIGPQPVPDVTRSGTVTVVDTIAPVAVNDSAETLEGVPVTIDVLGNDSDVFTPLTVVSTTQPGAGGTVVNTGGSLVFTPAPGFTGSVAFSYNVADPNGNLATASVIVEVLSAAGIPVAAPDLAATSENLAVTTGNVLANDALGDAPTTITAFDQASANSGTVTSNGDGTFTYTPAVNFVGVDTFTYTITDADGDSSTATVTITVTPVNAAPDAVDNAYATDEDTAVIGNAIVDNTGAGVDSDPDGDALKVVGNSAPANGSVLIAADGGFNYTPNANYHGVDSFTYTVTDGEGGSDTATVTITVTPVNDMPDALDNVYATDEDTAVIGNVIVDNTGAGVDSDLDGDALMVSGNTAPANGAVVVNGDGSFTYTPNANYNGSDSFTYTVTDGEGGSDAATVAITIAPVNDDPGAADDAATTSEDTPVTVGVLGNDSDVDGDTLATVSTAGGPANGSVVVNPDGTVTYTPDANFHGVDTFTYSVTDNNGGTAAATVTITVASVNDTPDAVDNAYATDEDTAVSGNVIVDNTGAGVDSDLDGDALMVSGNTEPANGAVVVNGDGSFTYTPDANYNGSDSFTYTVTDGNGGSDTATVVITIAAVNDDPDAADDAATTSEDTPVTVGVLGNDSDVDGDTLVTVTTAGGPANGSVVINPDGTVTYTPDANFHGVDTFNYTVMDNNGGTAAATVTITVTPVNDAPVAANDLAETDEDTPVTISVLGNDGDLDGDALQVVSAGPASNGTVVVNPDGSVTYAPASNFCGADSFTYTVSDGAGGEAVASVTVVVNCVNDAPLATDNLYATSQDTAVSGNVMTDNTGMGVDNDPEGDALTAVTTPVIAPVNGSVTISADGSFTYTPAVGFVGSDSFVYQIVDGNGGSAVATVAILVEPVSQCAACDGKVSELTLRYDGPGTVTVKVVQQKGEVAFEGQVSSGGVFTAIGQDRKDTLSPKVKVYINGELDTEIHTSCSVPIGPGQTWGSFTIVEGYSRNGGQLCPVAGGGSVDSEPDGDRDCDKDGKSDDDDESRDRGKGGKSDDDDDQQDSSKKRRKKD